MKYRYRTRFAPNEISWKMFIEQESEYYNLSKQAIIWRIIRGRLLVPKDCIRRGPTGRKIAVKQGTTSSPCPLQNLH